MEEDTVRFVDHDLVIVITARDRTALWLTSKPVGGGAAEKSTPGAKGEETDTGLATVARTPDHEAGEAVSLVAHCGPRLPGMAPTEAANASYTAFEVPRPRHRLRQGGRSVCVYNVEVDKDA